MKHFKKKLTHRLGALSGLQYIAPFEVKKSVAEGVFTSLLVYCLPLFGGTEDQNVKDLQVLQNRAAQIVCSTPPRYNRERLFDMVKWFSVNQLITYHTLLMIFKIKRYGQPEYLAKILDKDTRSQRIVRTKAKLTLTGKSFTFRGAAVWNLLPLTLRTTTSQEIFKREVKEWVHQNVRKFLD